LIKRWKATIRLAQGLHQVVFVNADTAQKALLMLELQFGKSRVVGAPVLVAIAQDVMQSDPRARFTERLCARIGRQSSI
jgi:hypothetical protein